MNISTVLTIAGSDSGGGAGIQADLKTITALGCYGASVITALTAQNTRGVHGIMEVPPDFVSAQFDAVMDDIGADAAKTGMLATPAIVYRVAEKIRQWGIKRLVVDPVMVAKGGASLLSRESVHALKTALVPCASIITPNIPEAETLAEMTIANPDDMARAAKKIATLGVPQVLVKGGHLDGDALDILFDGSEFHYYTEKRIPTKNTHGTGCTFSAAIAAGLAQGKTAPVAVRAAKDYVTAAIRYSLDLGSGHGPTNHNAGAAHALERQHCVEALQQAIRTLAGAGCGPIIPEVQSNLGYALPFALRESDIAAFPGRIVRVGNNAEHLHGPEFGASRHIAHIILTAMRHDPAYRSAMNIKFSESILEICADCGFSIDSFSRLDEPASSRDAEGSTLEWGTNSVLERRRDVPDIIFDRGDVGKEPMVRVLGHDPEEVAQKALKISARLNTIQ